MWNGLIVDRLNGHVKGPAGASNTPGPTAEQWTRKFDMSNDSKTTQRDDLAREIRVADAVAARDTSSNEYEAMADAVLAKYIPVPRPKVGEARRGTSQIILIDHVAISDDADWLRSELAAEELAMESRAYRIEHIRAALAYLETEKTAQAETKLQERRDALTHALIMDGKVKHGAPWSYAGASPLLQRAVDHIIELEDAAEAAK